MSDRICVIGLGNPGARYRHTRHNIGFDWLDAAVADIFGSDAEKAFQEKFKSLYFRAEAFGHEFHFLKPQTYMNESGRAAAEWAQKFQGEKRILVVLDDLDLPLGKLRLRPDGSDGGHRGLRSMIECLGTSDIPRLRIGIGRPAGETIDYVLESFKPEEKKVLDQVFKRAGSDLKAFAELEMVKAMNQINGARIDYGS